MVFDILQNKFSQILSIAPSPENADQLYEDLNCFNRFMMCRTSDVYEESDRQLVKFQLFTLYKENIGRLFCEEFLFRHNRNGTFIQTIG
jgi:hypothetical protein